MSACICILGVAWLGDTFVSNNIDWIKDTAGEVIQGHPWLLAVIFFFASALLYSQAATAKALMPMALALNVSPLTLLLLLLRCLVCSFCRPTRRWLLRYRWMDTVLPVSVNSSSTIRSSSRVLWVLPWPFASASCWVASCCNDPSRGVHAPLSFPPTNILSPSVV